MLLIMSKNSKVARSNMTVDNKSVCSPYDKAEELHSLTEVVSITLCIVHSSFVTYQRVCNWRKTMGATSGAGIGYPIVVCLFFLLAIVLPVLLQFADSDYPFGVFKLFLNNNLSKELTCHTI